MKLETVNRIVPQFYKRNNDSPWMAIPPMSHRSLASFLLFGTYVSIQYSDGTITIR